MVVIFSNVVWVIFFVGIVEILYDIWYFLDDQKGRVHVVSELKCVVVKPFSYVSILYKTKL